METRSVTGPGELSELANGSFELAFGKDKLLLDASSEELLPLDRAKLRKLLGTVEVTVQQILLERSEEPATHSFVRLERPTSTYVVDLGQLKPTTVTWVKNTLLMQGMEAM
jgi:hypothetical protein